MGSPRGGRGRSPRRRGRSSPPRRGSRSGRGHAPARPSRARRRRRCGRSPRSRRDPSPRRGRRARPGRSSSRASGSCACGGRRRSTRDPRAARSPRVCGSPASLRGDVEGRPAAPRRRRTPPPETEARRAAASFSRAFSSSAKRRSAAAASSGWEATSGGSTIAHPEAAASSRRRRRPSADGTTIAAERRSSARASPVRPVRTWTRSRRRSGIDGRAASRPVRSTIASQSSRLAKRAESGAHDGAAAGRRLDHDALRLLRGREEVEIDAGRDDRVGAGEAIAGAGRDLVARREKRVDPREQTVAVRASRREAEPLRVDEGRRRGASPPRAARRTRARERPGRSRARRRSRRVAARSRRSPAPRSGSRPPTAARREQPATRRRRPSSSPRLQRPASREEIGGARRRRQHDDGVTPSAQSIRNACDVLVRVVRHRPGVRCHEADAERHGSWIVGRRAAFVYARSHDRGHDHRARERPVQDHRPDHDRRCGRDGSSRCPRAVRSCSVGAATRARSRSATRRTSGSGSSRTTRRRGCPRTA